MDGKVFDMKDFAPGSTAPPFHNRCRTATAPYFDDEFDDMGERAARDEDGYYYTVPSNMKYDDWYKAYVDIASTKAAMSLQLKQLTESEKDVLTKMTGALSSNINHRIGKGERLDKFADQIKLIDSALVKGVTPKELNLIRKTAPEFIFPNVKKIDLDFLKLQIGRIVENPIYTSTSFVDFDYPLRNLIIHLKVPKGYKGALYIKDLAYEKFKYQEEVLFARGLKYRIVDVRMESNKYIMYAEVIK